MCRSQGISARFSLAHAGELVDFDLVRASGLSAPPRTPRTPRTRRPNHFFGAPNSLASFFVTRAFSRCRRLKVTASTGRVTKSTQTLRVDISSSHFLGDLGVLGGLGEVSASSEEINGKLYQSISTKLSSSWSNETNSARSTRNAPSRYALDARPMVRGVTPFTRSVVGAAPLSRTAN